jgi:tetratricopeptide (TPR) repeat protein
MAVESLPVGVYSKTETAESGQGVRAKKFQQKTYWFARQRGDDLYEICPMNIEHLPSKLYSTVSKVDFLKTYAPEPDYYKQNPCPFLQTLKQRVDSFLSDADMTKLNQDERRFCEGFLLDSRMASRFGGELKAVKACLKAMMEYSPETTEVKVHEFNSNAISLRKAAHHDEALRYYHVAMGLNEQDENLRFNAARVCFEISDYECCIKHLGEALRLNPRLKEAEMFLDYIDGKVSGLDERSKEVLKNVKTFPR